MALKDMKSDLAIGVGSKQRPQSFQDGHSATTVTGAKTFPTPPRTQIESKVFTALSRQGEELKFQFDTTFATPSLLKTTVPKLQDYYDRAFKDTDKLGARNNNRLGFDEPFILKAIGDRWGPGNLGSLDGGIIRGGIVTSAARTAADVQRIGKFLLTPRGVGFVIKQNLLQGLNAGGPVMRADMPAVDGRLEKIIGDRLGKPHKLLLEPRQQRFSTGRDVFGSTPPTVQNMGGSDIRSWRVSSIVDSLPLGAHYVRHQVPAGSPSVQLVKNVSNFVIDMGGGVLKFMDGIDVAFPGVSLNPSFQAGDILTGAGKAIKNAANGIVDVFPNIYDTAKSGAEALGRGISDIIGRIEIPKFSLGRLDGFTTLFPDLIKIPTIATPDFSALKGILGGLASAAASLISSIPIPGIKLPNISLPKLPNMKLPKLPKISLPNINIGNPFSALKGISSGLSLNFPKFSGFGGLGSGNMSFPDLSNAFPSVRLGAQVSNGSLQFNMASFDAGKKQFQSGLQNVIKLQGALNASSPKRIKNPGIPDYINNGQPYGEFANIAGSALGDTGTRASGTEDTPSLYYTTANVGIAQDSKGTLSNIYNQENSYSKILIGGKPHTGITGYEIDAETFDDKPYDLPYAIQAGFLSGARYGVEDKNFPLNSEKTFPVNAQAFPIFPNNAVEKHSSAGRLQKYEMLSYGQLGKDDSYSEINKGTDANTTRGIGHQGGSSRTAVDNEGNVIQVTSGGGYKNEKADLINLHPYGGTTLDDRVNDTELDFVPLKFRDMVNGKWIIFRAILESVSDTASPEYAEERYIGRPDKVYVYQGATRNVSITFKVMPKTVQELIVLWDKLNFLRGLVYPTVENNRMVSPFFHFTLGDMFNKQPMIFQSLNYAVDTASTWEIKPGLRLPKLIQVSADMRVIDKTTPETTGKHYGLDWLPEGQTFRSFKPDLPSSLIPDYTKYGELWGEVSYPMVSDTDFMTLLDADDQIAGAKALIDSLKSDVDVPNFDIPKLPTDLF
jgi:hypothetical protein